MNTARRWLVPVYLDHFQSAAYRHVATTVEPDGSLVAHFGDGSNRPSVYRSIEEMEAAAETDWRERMREVKPKIKPEGRRFVG